MTDIKTTVGIAMDSRSLHQLKVQSQNDPNAAAGEAARQFEALFIQQMLTTMRAAGSESTFFKSSAMDTYTAMLDQQLATEMAGRGIGLAEQLTQQLQQYTTPKNSE